MNELKYPTKTNYWYARSVDRGILHYGKTEPDQVTTTGQSEFSNDDLALMIDGLQSQQIDEIIINCADAELGADIIDLNNQPRTEKSDEAVKKLNEQGTIVITPVE